MSLHWIKHHAPWLILNLFATAVMLTLLQQASIYVIQRVISDPLFENSGRWAIRFLLFSLAMTPLNSLFNWRAAITLRKPAGLWAFTFGVVHLLAYLAPRLNLNRWTLLTEPAFVPLGIGGLFILSLLALTSNRWAMKVLGKNWKRLHRLVYLAGAAVIIHAMWAGMITKRGLNRDGNMAYEFRFYFAMLILLLVLRVPLVKRILRAVLQFASAIFSPRRRQSA